MPDPMPGGMFLSDKRLCHNREDTMFVILNEVKNLIESMS